MCVSYLMVCVCLCLCVSVYVSKCLCLLVLVAIVRLFCVFVFVCEGKFDCFSNILSGCVYFYVKQHIYANISFKYLLGKKKLFLPYKMAVLL